MTDDSQTDQKLCTLTSDPRADAKARGMTLTREQSEFLTHHIRNDAQLLCVGKRSIRDSAEGCMVRLRTLAETIEDLGYSDEPTVTPGDVWDAALAIAGATLERISVHPKPIHRISRSTTGPGTFAESQAFSVTIRVQVLNDKPRTTENFGYSSQHLAGALEQLRLCMPGDFEEFQKRFVADARRRKASGGVGQAGGK